jgi:hypothetical protein
LFVDPDCVVLAQGWDVMCKAAFEEQRCVAVGAPYHSSKLTKYHDFPSPVFILFKTQALRAVGADWIPYALPFGTRVRDRARRAIAITGGWLGRRVAGPSFYVGRVAAWMRRVLGNSSKDTGWRIPSRVRQHGYSARLFTPVVAARQLRARYAGYPVVTRLAEEFELFAWDGIPVLTHCYGTRHRRGGNLEEALDRWRALARSAADVCGTVAARRASAAVPCPEGCVGKDA